MINVNIIIATFPEFKADLIRDITYTQVGGDDADIVFDGRYPSMANEILKAFPTLKRISWSSLRS